MKYLCQVALLRLVGLEVAGADCGLAAALEADDGEVRPLLQLLDEAVALGAVRVRLGTDAHRHPGKQPQRVPVVRLWRNRKIVALCIRADG